MTTIVINLAWLKSWCYLVKNKQNHEHPQLYQYLS